MTTTPNLDHLLWCLDNGFPAPITAALLRLVDVTSSLHEAVKTWNDHDGDDSTVTFAEAVEHITGWTCLVCEDCHATVWDDEMTQVHGYGGVERHVCDDCLRTYRACEACEEHFADWSAVEGYVYCEPCFEEVASFCDECDEYYLDVNAEYHQHRGCECEAPHTTFEFPNNGDGTVTQDQRFTIHLPKGTIDEQGLGRIRALLHSNVRTNDGYRIDLWELDKVLDTIGPLWQAKRGNFTKRLSSALYKDWNVKVPTEILSEVGNLARQHSTDEAVWHIEFTRDLNQSAQAFANEGSCWWSVNDSYGQSRCALKSWGGLGLRSYDHTEDHSNNPTGRIWVQPVDENMKPTHATLDAHAYVVFNGYGELDGYVGARIIAHLTGKTYRRIDLHSDAQYVNGGFGFLVAAEEVCANEDLRMIQWSADAHHDYDAQPGSYTYQRAA